MKLALAVLGACLLLGCNAHGKCDPDKQTGRYLQTTMEMGGTCGELMPGIVNLRWGLRRTPPGCIQDLERSQDDCHIIQTIACETDLGTVTVSTDIRDVKKDGSEFQGALTIQATGNDGSACLSGYSLILERQPEPKTISAPPDAQPHRL